MKAYSPAPAWQHHDTVKSKFVGTYKMIRFQTTNYFEVWDLSLKIDI